MTKQSLTKSEIKGVCDILRQDDGVGAKDYVEQFSWLLFLKVFEDVEKQLKDLAEAESQKYQYIISPQYHWSSWTTKDWKDKDELIHFVNKDLFPYLISLKGNKQKDKISEIFRELPGNKIRSPHNLLDIIKVLNKLEMKDFQDTHLLSQVYEEILQEMGNEGGWSGEVYTPRPVVRLVIKMIDPKIGEEIFDPFTGSAGFLIEAFNYLRDKNKIGVKEWKILQNKTFSGIEKKPLPFLIGTMNMILHQILVPDLERANTFNTDIHNINEKERVDIILTNPPFGAKDNRKDIQSNFPIPISATEGLALQYVMKKLKKGGRCGVVLPEGQILFGGGAFQKIREELLDKFNLHSVISLPQGVFTQMGAGVKTNLLFFDKTGPTKEIWYGEIEGKFTKKKVITDEHLESIFKKWKKREVSENSWIVKIDEIKERGFDISPKNPNKAKEEKLPEPKEILKMIDKNQKEVGGLIKKIVKEL